MFKTQINSIIQTILTNVPQFNGNGYYVERGKESFKFTDNIPFWFYIDWPEGENVEFDDEAGAGCSNFKAVGNLRLIAHLRGVDMCEALEVLTANLLSTNLKVNVTSASIDEEIILRETFDKKPKDAINVLMIMFSLSAYGNLKCTGLTCDEFTC